ncbi:metal-dependent transcriptional regulator [Desulfosediminicola ganghwensis]|uniref:metal-dependent transcriptional regulator n=1 Tax=Desulfosediminicola ganghwensis TaxID=2569540 RepID=UPI0010AD0C79|nr:metal-dependent transcriptional regulator [Desulfosediminicola ganghwensis]
MLNERLEEILEAIWVAREKKQSSLAAIRENCAIQFSGSELKALERNKMVLLNGDEVHFTHEGEKLGKVIIRRHRLAEVLVTSILKVKKHKMHEIACEFEHSLQAEVEESICTLLGHPEVCPDGKSIPPGVCCKNNSTRVENTVTSLIELSPGEQGRITYIKPGSHSNLHQLLSFGLSPGVTVTVHRTSPAFCVKFENTELALDPEIAKNIFVWKTSCLLK